MSVYIVARLNINDRDEYTRYEAGFIPAIMPFEAEILAVEEEPRVLEGEWNCTRTVLLRFSDPEELQRWYQSDGYQAILPHRLKASQADIAMLRAFEMPEPEG